MRYILTILPTLKKSAFKELKTIDPEIVIKHLDSFIFIAETEISNFEEKMQKTIFTRHIHPINSEIILQSERSKALEQIFSSVKDISDIKNKRFMVQCRKIGKDLEYNSKDVEVFVGTHLEKLGGIPVFDDKDIISDTSLCIISVLIFDRRGFLGFSKITDNLEPYSDPARIYSRWEKTISRAEFKLREAIRKFGIKLEKGMNALDIGAAPGGWSKVLQEFKLNVTAVDPANLDERLRDIRHFKGKAEDFTSNERFDILVNDMNMDPRNSAEITISMKKFLKEDAKIVFTAKMVYKNYDKLISDTREILEKDYRIITIKNLFHNHEEVTFYMQLK